MKMEQTSVTTNQQQPNNNPTHQNDIVLPVSTNFQIRFNSFDRSHSDFILARSNFIFFFDTPQLTPSFNRDGRRTCSAAMLEPVWICHGPLTSFSRKLAPSAQTLVHDRCRSSDEGRPCFAAIRRHSSRRAYPVAMSCINRAKLTKVKTKKRMDTLYHTLSHACTCKPAFKSTVSADINSSFLSEFGRRL